MFFYVLYNPYYGAVSISRVTQPPFPCSKSTKKIPEQCVKSVKMQWRHVFLVSLLLILNKFQTLFSGVSIAEFEQTNAGWEAIELEFEKRSQINDYCF